MSSTRISRHINAPRAVVYRALLDPHAVAKWKVPDGMTCHVHAFDAREGGSFRISLTYDAPTAAGKTTGHTDTYHGRFVRLVPNEQVVEVDEFETQDTALRGEMTITLTLVDSDGGTDLLAVHDGLPPAVSPADNEAGWRMALARLAALVETGWKTATAPGTRCGYLERPGCRVYYEVTGSGPAIIFAHGIGSNHMTWWQQVAHFSDRYACVTFSHRGYPPGSEIGVPDPKEFAGDLAALIEHLQLPDVRLVAQSMGGVTAMEYILANPQHKARALVLASTCGSIHQPSVALADPQRLAEWERMAAAARSDMQRRGISPPAGERMALENPAMHFLYRSIANASSAFDREALRKRLHAIRTRAPDVLRGISMPTLFVTGEEDTTFPPFLADALARLMPNAKVEQVRKAGHSVYFQRPSIFNDLVDRFFAAIG